jgi:hypothetical protein
METIGWIATAVFSTSYFFREQVVLRRIQAAAACLWIAYGVALHARPVIIANLIVAAAALYSARRRDQPDGPAHASAAQPASALAGAAEYNNFGGSQVE